MAFPRASTDANLSNRLQLQTHLWQTRGNEVRERGQAMWLIRLFTGFTGRIGRFAYWFGLIALIAISPFSVGAVLSADPFGEALRVIKEFGATGLGWTAALLFGLAALNTKRLHDLGQSGLYGLLFYIPAALSAASLFTGWAPPQLENAIWWSTFVAGWMGAAGIWFLVRLGLFSGTNGPNKYGPDPSSA